MQKYADSLADLHIDALARSDLSPANHPAHAYYSRIEEVLTNAVKDLERIEALYEPKLAPGGGTNSTGTCNTRT